MTPFLFQEGGRIAMSAAIFGVVMVLCIGILIAHALDAFRS
jgi:hypothetical protein